MDDLSTRINERVEAKGCCAQKKFRTARMRKATAKSKIEAERQRFAKKLSASDKRTTQTTAADRRTNERAPDEGKRS